jgi:hypothetical protein
MLAFCHFDNGDVTLDTVMFKAMPEKLKHMAQPWYYT